MTEELTQWIIAATCLTGGWCLGYARAKGWLRWPRRAR